MAYQDNEQEQVTKTWAGEKAKLIGVFSPVRRCYQTTFSVLMGRLLLGRGRVLYLSFEFCEGCEEFIPPEKCGNLSPAFSLISILLHVSFFQLYQEAG